MDYIEDRNKRLFNDGKNKGYICICCRKETRLDNSASYKGVNLICNPCIYRMCNTLGLQPSTIISYIQKVGRQK